MRMVLLLIKMEILPKTTTDKQVCLKASIRFPIVIGECLPLTLLRAPLTVKLISDMLQETCNHKVYDSVILCVCLLLFAVFVLGKMETWRKF